MSKIKRQNPDGSWSDADPLEAQGPLAVLEFQLRSMGFMRLANWIARLDERGLGK